MESCLPPFADASAQHAPFRFLRHPAPALGSSSTRLQGTVTTCLDAASFGLKTRNACILKVRLDEGAARHLLLRGEQLYWIQVRAAVGVAYVAATGATPGAETAVSAAVAETTAPGLQSIRSALSPHSTLALLLVRLFELATALACRGPSP